jgi:hypothetical protein
VLLLKHLFVVIEGFAASPISRMGHLGGGWLAASSAERYDAHQHGAAHEQPSVRIRYWCSWKKA